MRGGLGFVVQGFEVRVWALRCGSSGLGFVRKARCARSEGNYAFSALLFTEGRVVGLCWSISNLKDLTDAETCEAGPPNHHDDEVDSD